MTLPGKSARDVTARDVGTPASSVSGPVTTKNALVERERKKKLKSQERKGIKKITGTELFYLEESCAETAGADHIAPKLTIRVQISSMSSRCV